jgi:hypothetical protein
MAEIKSSIELAMERTKDLHLSPAEKEKIRQEETLNRLNGMVRRYQEGGLSLRDLEDELKHQPQETRDAFTRHALKALIDGIQLAQDNQRIFDAITALKKGGMDAGIRKRIDDLVKENQKALEKGLHSIESLLREKLAGIGIRGNALIPNTEGSTEWQEFQRKTGSKFERELNELKEKI